MYLHRKKKADNQKKVGALGGIEAVVKIINTRLYNFGICKWGCDALYAMTADNGKIYIYIYNR